MTTPDEPSDPDLAAAFAKDPADERFLATLNHRLAAHELDDYAELDERWPTVHVIGPPRAGTTLATQLLAAHLDLGCINNLVAAFWAAPVHGIRLAKKLLPIPAPSTYRSRYGRTERIGEPHEFGYFWAALLGDREMAEPSAAQLAAVDWPRVRRTLLNMCAAYARPVLFKALAASFYLPGLVSTLPRTCVIRMRRDPVDNALSILRMRHEYAADPSTWVSLRPREYAWLRHEPLPRQAAGQVVFTHAAIDRGLAAGAPAHLLDVDYAAMCEDPAGFLSAVESLLASAGAEVPRLRPAPPPFEVRRPRGEPEARARIEAALADFGERS